MGQSYGGGAAVAATYNAGRNTNEHFLFDPVAPYYNNSTHQYMQFPTGNGVYDIDSHSGPYAYVEPVAADNAHESGATERGQQYSRFLLPTSAQNGIQVLDATYWWADFGTEGSLNPIDSGFPTGYIDTLSAPAITS